MPIQPTSVLPRGLFLSRKKPQQSFRVAPILVELASTETHAACGKMQSAPEGLREDEAERRLEQYGFNVVAPPEHHSRAGCGCCFGPASIRWWIPLLTVLATVS